MKPSPLEPRVIVALDYPDADSALGLVQGLDPHACRVKVGFELFVNAGPRIVDHLVEQGFDVFLDLKFHDIPNTVASACRAASRLGVWMINVHAAGGRQMMAAAREAVEAAGHRPRLIAVTVLTSMSPEDLRGTGVERPLETHALALAQDARTSGLDGVVCSALEAPLMRRALGEDFLLVTPGIRLASTDTQDQKRVTTAELAIRAGADYLVIGRPVTRAERPMEVLARINREVATCRY